MTTAALPQIRMRSKHQFTLPARIARQANIQTDDRLTVAYANGQIILIPIQSRVAAKDDVMSYAGLYSGAWGGALRDDEWES